jgi:hypothetical protein
VPKCLKANIIGCKILKVISMSIEEMSLWKEYVSICGRSMMSISKQYTREMKAQLNYSATWLPTIIVSPGDVGTVSNYEFHHLTNIAALGVKLETIPGSSQMEFDYCSANSVSIFAKSSGQAPLAGSSFSQADAGISVKFSRNNAIVSRLSQCSSTRIADLNSLRKEILLRYRSKEWRDDMVVVTEAVKAARATIIISNSSNAQIDLLVRGNVGPRELHLANASAEFQVLRSSNIAFQIIAEKDLTPLFRFAGIKKPFLGSSEPKLELEPMIKQRMRFGLLDYSDFEPATG